MKCKNFILPIICFILLSCEGETIDPIGVSKAVRLNAEIEGMRTRMSGSAWEKGDAIGVYMKKAGVNLDASALAQNVEYRYSNTSGFVARNLSDALYFPFKESAVDFIGYYPFREDITGFNYPVNLKNQSNQAAIDLLYSDNVKGKSENDTIVNLSFSHQLSKLVLQVTHYRGIDLSGLSVILTSVPTESSFNLTDGSLSASSGVKDIAMGVNVDGTIAEAILLPGTDLSESHLWLLLGDDQVYHVALPDTVTTSLKQSSRYLFHVTLSTDVKAAVTTGEITDWLDEPSQSVSADRTEDDPPLIKGSKRDPYTVAEALVNQGETAAWVKGYIVGAFDGAISRFVTDTTGQVRTNVALADLAGETDVSNMLPVNITLVSLKNALNITDNPGNIGREVMIKGDLAAYYSVPGLRETKAYQFPD
jgi:hypothetical protein